jgi:hypothetical protein
MTSAAGVILSRYLSHRYAARLAGWKAALRPGCRPLLAHGRKRGLTFPRCSMGGPAL